MRKMIQRGIVVLLGIIMGGLLLLTEAVYASEEVKCEWGSAFAEADADRAEESSDGITDITDTEKNEIYEEGILPIKITRDDGIEITPKDKEVININTMLLFSAGMGVRKDLFVYRKGTDKEYGDVDGLLSEKTDLQYSVSFDKGVTFGDWQSSDHGIVCISPAVYRDGEYCIKFRKLQQFVINKNRAETMRKAERDAEDCEDSKDAEKTEAEEEKVEAEGGNTEAEEGKAEEAAEGESRGEEPEEEGSEDMAEGGTKSQDEDLTDEKKEKEEKKEDRKEVKERREQQEVNGPSAEEKIHMAEEIALNEGIHVIESGLYYVNLDTAPPALILYSDAEEGEWKNKGVKCTVRINDTGSLPAWIRITYDDNNVAEESFGYDTGMSGAQKEFFINSESSSETGTELVVEAADRAGNRMKINRRIGIDKTKPEISIKGLEDGKVYGKPVSVSVTGTDLFPDSVCVGYTVRRIICGTEETVVQSAKTLSECNEGVLFETDTDGDYVIECHAADRAGNESGIVKRSFRVDSTPPGLKLEGINNGACLRGDAALRITACDNYESGYCVNIKGTVKHEGTGKELKLADYRTEGLISSNTYLFKDDGDYELSIEVRDSAGNLCSDGIGFTIDRTAPKISLSDNINTSEELVTNEPPVIRFGVKESNYQSTLVSYELNSVYGNEKKAECKASEWFMNSASDEFSVLVEEEGSYELVINAVDGAGNTSSKTVRFKLDMTSPQIDYVENLNKKYIKKFKLPENFNEYIKDQGEVSYQTYINSRNYDETEQIEEDGKYVLKVSAVDDAGNQTEKTVEFIVDGTMPRIIIDGMADDGSVNKDGIIVLSLYDEGDYFKSVRINGEEMISAEGQETVEIPIPEYGDYKIDVEAADMADNILTQTIEAKCANASPVEKGVTTVRTLKQTEKGSHKGLRVFLIIMTVLILGGSIVVFTLYNIKACGK